MEIHKLLQFHLKPPQELQRDFLGRGFVVPILSSPRILPWRCRPQLSERDPARPWVKDRPRLLNVKGARKDGGPLSAGTARHEDGTSILYLQERFPDEDSVIAYLFECQSEKLSRCDECGSRFKLCPVRGTSKYSGYFCKANNITITKGTILYRSAWTLKSWLVSMMYLTNSRAGVTTAIIGAMLGIGQDTAFRVADQIRNHMAPLEEHRTVGGEGKHVPISFRWIKRTRNHGAPRGRQTLVMRFSTVFRSSPLSYQIAGFRRSPLSLFQGSGQGRSCFTSTTSRSADFWGMASTRNCPRHSTWCRAKLIRRPSILPFPIGQISSGFSVPLMGRQSRTTSASILASSISSSIVEIAPARHSGISFTARMHSTVDRLIGPAILASASGKADQ